MPPRARPLPRGAIVCSRVRDKSRHVLSILLSAIAHVVVLLTGLFDLSPDVLDVDLDLEFELVEVDLVELDKVQGEEKKAGEPEAAAPPPPAPVAPPEPGITEEEPPPKEPEKPPEPEKPKRDLGQKRSNVDQLGPPNSTFHVLLSTRNIRKLPYAKLGMSVISALPDYEFLVTGGGFDPLKDFDHIVIASPDLRSVTQTFLAVDYKVSRETMKQRIEKACEVAGETIEWIDENGILRGNPKPKEGRDFDPRWFVLPEDKVAFYLRKEFLPAVLQEETGTQKTTANFISKMTKLKKYAQRIPTAGLQFEAHDLHAALKRTHMGKFELPDHIELTIEAEVDPEINLSMTFSSIVAAKEFETWWGELEKNITVRATVGGVLDDVELTQSGKEVTAWVELERKQTELFLRLIGSEVAQFQERAAKKREAEMKAAAEKAARDEAPAEPSAANAQRGSKTDAPEEDAAPPSEAPNAPARAEETGEE